MSPINPEHQHEEPNYAGVTAPHAHTSHAEHGRSHGHVHDTSYGKEAVLTMLKPAIFSLALLLVGLLLDHGLHARWFVGYFRLFWYLLAYLPVGWPVLRDAFASIRQRDVFSEFFLMSLATVGAFSIGEYPEGVAVMLFYAVGEVFQTLAVQRAQGNISKLLDQRPDEVSIIENNVTRTVKAAAVKIGDVIMLRPGDKVALDGVLQHKSATFNTAALTGESKPDTKKPGDAVLAGMINLNTPAMVEVTALYSDSKLSKILELVTHAASQKAPTELFIHRFAKVYTPVVVALAAAICILPLFFAEHYSFRDWLYRALIFLVISCPCALVISIPLGYFGGIGAASRHGILFKGSNFLDILADIKQVVMDKTGTMTEGVFKVQSVKMMPGFDRQAILSMVNVLENSSTHPIATAIHEYAGAADPALTVKNIEEIPGHGLRGTVDGKELLAGNFKLMDQNGIAYQINPNTILETVIAVAYDKKFAGYITISDRIRDDAKAAVQQLLKLGVKPTMLSGDKESVVQAVANRLGIAKAFGDLLPEDKVDLVKQLKAGGDKVAFAGDGVNDAPVVTLSDVGFAMGGLGSDATIESADVVLQDDRPSKIPVAIKISKATKKIVWQNIILAFVVKGIVLALGAGGVATMWEAVFADVGVALLAVLNAVRIQNMKF